ncbi:hypothetical protein STEG23_004013, partial [Scotinomys teguina]
MRPGDFENMLGGGAEMTFHTRFRNQYDNDVTVWSPQDMGPHIFQTCPSANYFDCRAMSIGARSQSARTYLERHMAEFMECNLDELVKHGLRALRETLPAEQDLTTKNVSIGIVGKDLEFTIYDDDDVSPFLDGLEERPQRKAQDHTIKKLLLVFWEIVPKTTPDGRLLHEMILVCDAYRKDLQHPNEFIRGSTLRFLCKLKEAELLEPLMPAIRACLEHRHSYVRRNAVLAIYTIYRNFEHLIPDAPELIHDFLVNEKDASCKRNAFMMLIHADQDRALDYLSTCIDQVQTFGDILQLVIVELIYKVCHANPSERARFIRCIYNLLQSSSPAVKYEAAGTLVTLSSAPTAIK